MTNGLLSILLIWIHVHCSQAKECLRSCLSACVSCTRVLSISFGQSVYVSFHEYYIILKDMNIIIQLLLYTMYSLKQCWLCGSSSGLFSDCIDNLTYSHCLAVTWFSPLCLLRIIHEQGFTREECKQYRPVVYSNTIQSLAAVIKGMDLLGVNFHNPARRVSTTPWF